MTLNYYLHCGKAYDVSSFQWDAREFFSLYVLQTGKHQETLQSVFTSLHMREPNHQTKSDRKQDFIA